MDLGYAPEPPPLLEEKAETQIINQNDRKERAEKLKKKPKMKIAFRFFKGLFITYAVTFFSLVLILTISVIDFDQNFSSYFHMYPWLVMRLCAAINPIIYPIFHFSFWKSYKIVFMHMMYSKRERSARKRLKLVRIKNAKNRRQYLMEMRALARQQQLELLARQQIGEIEEICVVPIDDLAEPNINANIDRDTSVPIKDLERLERESPVSSKKTDIQFGIVISTLQKEAQTSEN